MRFLDGAILLSFFTAFLYSASTAFTHGFLGTLNLDADVLDRDLHAILYHGMILCLHVIIIGPIILLLLSIVRSAIITEISRIVRNDFRMGRKISRWIYFFSFRPRQRRNALQLHHFNLNFNIFNVVVLLLSFVFLMAYLENEGKLQAKNVLDSIKNGKFVRVTSVDSGVKDSAFLYCGTRNCASLNPENGEIHYFPQEGFVIRQPLVDSP